MNHYPRLAARLYNTPLLILPEKGEIIVDVFRNWSEQHVQDATIVADLEDEKPREELLVGTSAEWVKAGYMRTNNGVAVMQVLGTLVHRGSSLDAMSGLTSYSRLSSIGNAAMNDPMVKAIVFEVDSPGGEAAGIFEFAALVREWAKTKTVYSVANEIALSGGYIIHSSATKSFMTEPGMVGSIGVVMYHVDKSKQLEKAGMVVTPIFAGSKKVQFSPHAPLSQDAMAWAQDSVNRTYDRFASTVAGFRSISVDAVKETDAALLHSDQAMKLKLVDGIATLAEVVRMASDKALRTIHSFSQVGAGAAENAHNVVKENGMEPKVEGKDGTAPATGAAVVDTSAAVAAAVAAERQRGGAILGCDEAKGKQKLAQHLATNTSMSVEDAKATLKVASPEVAENPLAAAMKATKQADIGAGGDGAATASASAGSAVNTVDANSIFAKRRVDAEKARANQ